MSQMAKPSHLPRLSDQWLTCRGAAEELGVAQTDNISNPAHWAAATLQASQSLGAAGAALLCRPYMSSQLQGLMPSQAGWLHSKQKNMSGSRQAA